MDSPDQPPAKKSRKSKKFQHQWYDDYPEWKTWVKPCPTDPSKYICAVCNLTLICGVSEISNHSTSTSHLKKTCSSTLDRVDSSSSSNSAPSEAQKLNFNQRVKGAEVRFAKLIAENNIPMAMAPQLLHFFQSIGDEPAVLQAMRMGKTKVTQVINKVVAPHESQKIVKILLETKFSVFVDETSDIKNEKWMSFVVRYVDPNTLKVKTELLKLINVDATNCSAENLFREFHDALKDEGIPLHQIIGLACDNASVMVGSKKSFKVHMTTQIPHLVTLPCICHSLAIVASKACSAIPDQILHFVRGIPTFLNGSPKRAAIFQQFQQAFTDHPSKLPRLAETRWLSRQIVVSKILDNWQPINSFLIDQSSEKVVAADEWLHIMNQPMTKAYLIFLKFALDSFNRINAYFQSNDTLVHELQPSSKEFFLEILRRFLKPALLAPAIFDNYAPTMDFGKITNQRSLSEVDIGEDCQKYLQAQQSSGVSEADITLVRSHCLTFYVVASTEIRRTLPFADEFLADLAVFSKETALLDSRRELSIPRVENVCRKLNVDLQGGKIAEEWESLYYVDANLKQGWCQLSFDDMWMAISTFTTSDGIFQFSSLRSLLGKIRALPHSNAAAERAFSSIPDIKSKKRSSLTSETLNSICVIKSARKTRGDSASDLSKDLNCLELMCSSNLYSKNTKPPSTKVKMYTYVSGDEWEGSE